MASLFAVNTNQLVESFSGAALIFYAPYGTTFPTKIEDVVQLSGGATQWNPVNGWATLGATKSGVKVDRSFGKVDLSSDQSLGTYYHRPNSHAMSVSADMLRLNEAGLRLAWEGGPSSTAFAGTRGTISGSVAAGAAAIPLMATFSITSGDTIIVGNNFTQEWHGAWSGGTTITLLAGETLAYARVSGETVIKPVRTSFGLGHVNANTPRMLSVLAPLVQLSATDYGNVTGMRMYSFRLTLLGEGNRSMNHAQDAQWSLPVMWHCYRDTSSFGSTDEIDDTAKVFTMSIP